MDKLIGVIGRSLLISCMIPAIVLVTVSMVLFAPELPGALLIEFQISEMDFGGVLSIVLVVSFVLAYVLMIMNWGIVRLFEGYYTQFGFCKRKQLKKKRRLKKEVVRQEKLLQTLPPNTKLYQRKWRTLMEKRTHLVTRYPKYEDDFLPFRLGNIYRAFEDYSFDRYGMDGVFFWPRLIKVVPEDYLVTIQEQNNRIAFLLNSSLTSLLIGLETFVSFKVITVDVPALISLVRAGALNLGTLASLIGLNISGKVIIPVICAGLSYFFYHAATSTATTYGHYIRTCYDLYRFDLLKALQIDPPHEPGSEGERQLWQSVQEFLLLGERSPYERKSPDFSATALVGTLGRLTWVWVRLTFWSSLERYLDCIVTPAKSANANVSN